MAAASPVSDSTVYACDRCGTHDIGGHTLTQICEAFEKATSGAITAAHAHQTWAETLGELCRPRQPQLAHFGECPHTICIRCALETAIVAEDRTCPACKKYSYIMSAFVDCLLGNDPLMIDERMAHMVSDMRRAALVDVDHAGSSCDEEEAEMEMLESEEEARRQAKVAKKYIEGHDHVRALLASAATAGMFVNEDMCRYRDGLLALSFDQDEVGLTPVVELHVMVINKHVCRLFKLGGEHTYVPQWALNVMEVTA